MIRGSSLQDSKQAGNVAQYHGTKNHTQQIDNVGTNKLETVALAGIASNAERAALTGTTLSRTSVNEHPMVEPSTSPKTITHLQRLHLSPHHAQRLTQPLVLLHHSRVAAGKSRWNYTEYGTGKTCGLPAGNSCHNRLLLIL